MDLNKVEARSLFGQLWDFVKCKDHNEYLQRVSLLEQAIQRIKGNNLAALHSSGQHGLVGGGQHLLSVSELPPDSISSPNNQPSHPCPTAEATTGLRSPSTSLTKDISTNIRGENGIPLHGSNPAFQPQQDIVPLPNGLRRVRDASLDSSVPVNSDLETMQTNKKRRLSRRPPLGDGITRAQCVGDGLVVMENSIGFLKVKEEAVTRLQTLKTRHLEEARKKKSRTRKRSTLADAAKPTLKEVESIEQCTLFWSKVFGKCGIARLSAFVEAVKAGNTITDNDPVLDSSEIASPAVAPPAVQGVLRAYHRQLNDRSTATIGRFLRQVHLSDFNRQYNLLVDDASKDHSQIREIFRINKMETSRGRAWNSLVNDYLVHCLDNIDLTQLTSHKEGRRSSNVDPDTDVITQARHRLRNEVYLSQPYQVMERAFGRGVFALLPESDLNW